jgi:DNA-binding MarR family transcriptional regulator
MRNTKLAKELQMKKTETEMDELIESTLLLTERAFRELFPILPKEWLNLDLTTPQLKVVLLLYLSGPTRMSVIASALDVSLATATGVVDRLVKTDMVTRGSDPNDRRVVLCRLSDKGEKLITGLWQKAGERVVMMFKALDRRKLQLVKDALEVLLEAGEVAKGQLQISNDSK